MSLLQLLLVTAVCCYVGGAGIKMKCPAENSLSVCQSFKILQAQTETCNIPLRDEDGYQHNPGLGYHKFYPRLMTWHEAKRQCQNDGGHLAVIDSHEEATVLLKLFAEHVNVHPDVKWDYEAWLGASYELSRATFVTVFGERLDCTGYSIWHSVEPNNYVNKLRRKGGEDCLTLRRDGKFKDLFCDNTIAFFCEKPL